MTKANRLFLCAAAATLGVAAGAPQASAAFVVVEDFQSRTLGPVNGQNGFTAGAGAQVVLDPANATNRLLQVSAADTSVAKGISIADNTTATLYFQIKTSAPVNASLGATDVAAPTEFAAFESQVNVNASTPVQPIRIRDLGVFDALSDTGGSASTITSAQPIGVFLVINNTTNTTEVYLQEAGDAAPVLQVNGAQDDFGFRNTTAADLVNFYIRTGGAVPNTGEAPGTGPFFVDNIYLDATGANLAAPAPLIGAAVPEPATFGLLGVAGVALAARRRRR
jgi:hypothetical protein